MPVFNDFLLYGVKRADVVEAVEEHLAREWWKVQTLRQNEVATLFVNTVKTAIGDKLSAPRTPFSTGVRSTEAPVIATA